MSFSSFFRRRAAFRVLDIATILLFLCALRIPARAAEKLTMQVDSPLASSAKPLTLQIATGRWFPVAVTLSNSGDSVSGRLQLQLTSTGNSATGSENSRDATYFADVDLPTNARKRVWIYARGEGEFFDGATISFSGRGLKTTRQNIALKPLGAAQRTILTISDSGERLGFLSGLKGRELAKPEELKQFDQETQGNYSNSSSTRNTFLRPLGTSHEFLPDRAVGLEAADIVVFRDFSQSALTPEQLNALRNYVAQGGTLVVFGGSDWQRLSTSPLKDLWPLDVTSSRAASANETAEAVARYVKPEIPTPKAIADARKRGVKLLPKPLALSGADRLGGSPMMVLGGELRADSVAKFSPNSAVSQSSNWLSARDYGAGRVVLLAADPSAPPFLGWSGQGNLWGEIVANVPRAAMLQSVGKKGYDNGFYDYSDNAADSTTQLLQVIRRLPQLQTPPTSRIAWFLAIYVFCLVPLNYFILRSFDRRELAWLTIPLIAIAFSVVSYVAARRIKGTDLLVRQINIVQGSGTSDQARSDSMLWLYSPRRASYNISSTQPMAFADYISGDSKAPASSLNLREPEANRAFRAENNAVKMWDEAQFVGQGNVATGGGIVLQNGAAFRVLNKTPFDLRNAVLLTKNGFYRCGDIASNASASAKMNGIAPPKNSSPFSNVENPDAENFDFSTRVAQLSDLETIFPSAKKTTNSANFDTSALADSTLRDLALATLRASLKYNPQSSERILVAWSQTPAAPLEIENASTRQQSVTLFIFRLPAAK